MNKAINFLWLSIPLFLFACGTQKPAATFSIEKIPNAPDYSKAAYWAALPTKTDASDLWAGKLVDSASTEPIDVFYLYPTIYTGSKRYQHDWNAPLDNPTFNNDIQNVPIKFQASIFNGVGRIYAPYYRQAHIEAYFTKDTASAKKAFALAYNDVRNAFEYYLNHYNQGRPIIIAAHSQGTTHAERLIKDYFDTTNLKNRLVVAYLLGMPISKQAFKAIPPCENEHQTGCFCSWRTYEKGYYPDHFPLGNQITVTNPLSWNLDNNYVDRTNNKGAILRNFDKLILYSNDAQAQNGVLWTNKPKFRGSFLLRTHNFHAGDFNLFFMNIRENAKHRIKLFWK